VRRLWIAVIILAALSLSPTAAQTTIPLMTVDAVNVGIGAGQGWTLDVTGVVQGEAAPTTRSINFGMYGTADALRLAQYEACHRSLLFALSRPGQYVARIGYQGGNYVCTIALLTP
jgi:hypothetical protein